MTAGRPVRNVPGKRGPKPAAVSAAVRKADEVRLREQWNFYYKEWVALSAVVRNRGRVFTDRFGQPKDRPEVAMRERVGSHLLSVSRALADIIGLAPEEAEKAGTILSLVKKRENGG